QGRDQADQGPDRRRLRRFGDESRTGRGALRSDVREADLTRDQGAGEEVARAREEPRVRGGGEGARPARRAQEAGVRGGARLRMRGAFSVVVRVARGEDGEPIRIRHAEVEDRKST